MSYTYECMRASDYSDVLKLWQSTPGLGLSSADGETQIASYLLRNPDQSFICRADGQIVGTILCGNDGRRAYIHHTAVLPAYRNAGIASALVALALKKQRSLGIEKCHLFVFRSNTEGHAFWHKMGFTQRGDIDIMSATIVNEQESAESTAI